MFMGLLALQGSYNSTKTFMTGFSVTGGLTIQGGMKLALAPINLATPVVTCTSQFYEVGSVLTCQPGTWIGVTPIGYSYTWYRGGSYNGFSDGIGTYTLQSSDIGYYMTCYVTATNAYGQASVYSNSVGPVISPPLPGQSEYTSPGTYTWTAPAGITSVSVVAVGPGADFSVAWRGGGGGGLGYRNTMAVTPGVGYTVYVGANSAGSAYHSYFVGEEFTVYGYAGQAFYGGGYAGEGGGYGGYGGWGGYWPGGGGAGGYSGNGGNGGDDFNASTSGSGGGGGGGGGWYSGGGGGVGIYGQGNSGGGGGSGWNGGNAGGGGSGGQDGNDYSDGSHGGGLYGGGGGRNANGAGGCGAVRIIWPGTTRQFPSTNTGNL